MAGSHTSLARLLCLASCLVAGVWCVSAWPRDVGLATERQLARRIAEGYSLDPDVVERAANAVAGQDAPLTCDGDRTRIAALLQIKRVEDILRSRDQVPLEAGFRRLDRVLDARLACAPSDSFAWFSRFWLKLATGNFQKSDEKLLSLSYRTGPEETWVARRRNLVVAALLPMLGDDTKAAFRRELLSLVVTRQYDVAARVLAFIDPETRGSLREDLKQVDHRTLQYLEQYMAANDLPVISLPGIEPITGKPRWLR